MDTDAEPEFGDGPAHDEDWGAELFHAGNEFADDAGPRCLCLLLLDTSRAMADVAALNDGLRTFADELMLDELAARRVEAAVVTFGGGVQIVQGFTPAGQMTLPELWANGAAPLGSGLLKSLDLIAARKAELRARGLAYYRPWLLLISGGGPSGEALDVTRQAVQRLRAEEAADHLLFFAVGTEDANLKWLAKLSARPPLRLRGRRFAELFRWLAAGVARIAHSRAGEQVELPPADWGSVLP